MSHQDQGRSNGFRYHHQALRSAIGWLAEEIDFSSLGLRDDCTWSARLLATAALLWAWSDELTLSDRFTKGRQIACKMFGVRKLPAASYQAFIKLLTRWTPVLAERLTEAFRRRMRQRFPKRLRVAGFCVFGVDGSRMELPRTTSNEARWSPKPKRKGKRDRRKKPGHAAHAKKANSPQLWITTLWNLGTQLPWSWRFGPSDSSERAHLREMLDELPANSLLVADAGFVGYDLWRQVQAHGCELLVRVGSNVRLLKNLGYARTENDLVYLWPNKAAVRRQPPLVLRLTIVNTGRHPVYLVTTVPKQRLSDAAVASLYQRRWGIELFYRHLKQTFDRRKLRSRNGDNARLEAEWSLLGLWAMALHAQHFQKSQRIDPARLSVAGMLRAYRRAMREFKSPPEPGESLPEMLVCAVKDDYERTRPKASRDYPRKKKEPPIKPPQITKATPAQIQLAAEIQKEIKYG